MEPLENKETRPEKGAVMPASRAVQDQDNMLVSGSLQLLENAHERQGTWNSPRRNIYKLVATYFGFIVMGLNDATYGAVIPYLQEYYQLEYAVVSLVFLSPFIGYNLAALLNNQIHLRLGQRGVALLSGLCHTTAYIVNCLHPPFPLLVISFILAGFGNGISDSGWNAWIGDLPNPNELLGLLHASYGIGAVIAPLIATAMITKAELPWFKWYYCMIGFGLLELLIGVHAFWYETGAKFRDLLGKTTDAQSSGGSMLKQAILKMPAARVTWLCALFMLGDNGAEVALGGWVVDFMLNVRHAADFASGMSATGFWLGMTVGRIVLGFVTPRLGEKLAISIYLPITMALELIFWLVPRFYVSVVAVAFQGFFLGPMVPTAMVACTKLLPKDLHVSGIGFAAAFGGSGAALFPYAVGAIAQVKGVQVLQPIILALLAVTWLLWLALPAFDKRKVPGQETDA